MMTNKKYVIDYFGFDPVSGVNENIIDVWYGLDNENNLKSVIAAYQNDFLYYSLRINGNKEENPDKEAYYKAIGHNLIQIEDYDGREDVDFDDLSPDLRIIKDINEAFDWLNELNEPHFQP